jgi:ABC-type nitrate/sulfonate/bicarbonate transport system substrate-binding protein
MGRELAPLTRRSVVTGLAAATAVPAFAQAPAIGRATRLTVTGYYRTPAFLVAGAKGFFAKQDLDVEFHLVRLAPEHNEGLAQGRWPITLSSADTMLARTTQDNVDFLIFLQPEQGLDVQLVAHPEITSLKELRGKLFAADPVDSNYDLVRNKIMRDNGVAESEYRIDILGNSSARAAAFMAGKVDAAMLQGQFSADALAKGARLLADGGDYIPDWPIVCGWGLRKWIEGNRDTVVRFSRAMAQASDWLLDPQNKEETMQLLMKEEKLSRPRAEKNYGFVVPKAAIRPEALRKNIEIRIELGYYKPPHKPTEAFYDAGFWSEATGLAAPASGGFPKNAIKG